MYTEHHYHAADGLRLYYRQYGDSGATLLCLPGLTRNCRDFERLAGHLGAQYRVITPDLRGRGGSGRDPKPTHYHPAQYVRDIWTLLNHLSVRRVIVIGTSLGGLLAMHMAEQFPRRLRGVVLNDIGPEIPVAAAQRIAEYAGRPREARDWPAAATICRQIYGAAYPNEDDRFWEDQARKSFRRRLNGDLTPDVDPVVGEALRNGRRLAVWLARLRKWGLKRRFAGIQIEPWDAFRAIEGPCLLLHGALSDVLTPEIIKHMHSVKPDLRVTTIPNRGHAPTLDEPESRQAIDHFLAGLGA